MTSDRCGFARALVEIDVSKKVKHELELNFSGGIQMRQKVEYEFVPSYCSACKAIGHTLAKRERVPAKAKLGEVASKLVVDQSGAPIVEATYVGTNAVKAGLSIDVMAEEAYIGIAGSVGTAFGEDSIVVEPLVEASGDIMIEEAERGPGITAGRVSSPGVAVVQLVAADAEVRQIGPEPVSLAGDDLVDRQVGLPTDDGCREVGVDGFREVGFVEDRVSLAAVADLRPDDPSAVSAPIKGLI